MLLASFLHVTYSLDAGGARECEAVPTFETDYRDPARIGGANMFMLKSWGRASIIDCRGFSSSFSSSFLILIDFRHVSASGER